MAEQFLARRGDSRHWTRSSADVPSKSCEVACIGVQARVHARSNTHQGRSHSDQGFSHCRNEFRRNWFGHWEMEIPSSDKFRQRKKRATTISSGSQNQKESTQRHSGVYSQSDALDVSWWTRLMPKLSKIDLESSEQKKHFKTTKLPFLILNLMAFVNFVLHCVFCCRSS